MIPSGKKFAIFKINLIFITFILTGFAAFGQINIEPGPDVTPTDMVENIVGEGIQYSNVEFQGADASRGTFSNGGSTNLGIGSGIFLTSGAGYNIPGPNASTSAGSNNGMPGHASLNAITTSTTYDAAVLEFDFIPESDTLRFKYVFGSEEYNEWVGSSFNDVFGYFVSGPDPEGGFYADKNVAIVPGTASTSVTINNVNNGYSAGGVVPTGPCTNCAYYNDNTGGLTIEYDGFTTVLVAWLLVVPCEEYHIKIGVADAGDGIYDSGVFIEENSFESPKIEVESDPFPEGVSDNMIEGCVEADIIFKLPNPEYAPITVYFEVEGTADPGAYPDGDFEEEIPTSITFEEDTDTAVIHVAPVKDGIIEGEETLILIIENTLGCIVRYDTVEFIIVDYVDMETSMSPNTIICQGQEIEIYVSTVHGIPVYSYDWEGFEIDNDTISVSPDTTTTYYVSVMDMCLDTVTDSTTVTVFPLPEVDIGDSTFMCEGDTLTLNAGAGYLGYYWQDGSTDSTYQVTQGGLYFVTVFGAGGCSVTDSVFIEETILEVDIGEDQTICIGDTVILDPGSGYINYQWQDGSIAQQYVVTQTGTYWVEVSVGACSAIDSVYVFVDDPSIGISLGSDTMLCMYDEITLGPEFGIYDGYLWSTGDTTSTITVSQPGTYSLEVTSDCGTASDQITIGQWPYPDPDLGEDMNLCYGETTTLEPTFGFSSYVWQDNSTLPFYTVSEAGIYYVDVTDIHGCEGTDTVFIEIADIVDLGEDSLILCEGETLTLDAGGGFDFYTWSTGEFGVQTIDVSNGGWYKVDVNYFFGCASADSVLVDAFPIPVAEITGDDIICEGDSVTLNASTGNFEYYWNNAAGGPSYTVSQGGNVTLKVANVCGEDTDDMMVELKALPDVDLGQDILLFPGETVTLDAGEFETYMWNSNPSQSGQYYEVKYEDVTGKDSVTVEVFDGYCKNSDGITIESFNVQIPNVVTPNGDGKNDDFTPMSDGFTGINSHNISVFNRWGEKVWESSDFISGWDVKQNGKYVAEGTYFWVLEVFYGTEEVKKVYKGTLTVLGTGS
jgi:gliding motility-associated-like protein